jgi:hypothetical protein
MNGTQLISTKSSMFNFLLTVVDNWTNLIYLNQKLRDRGQGFGILVSKFPKDTTASYSLQEPNEASII